MAHCFSGSSSRGGILTELLLTMALSAVILPFVLRGAGQRSERTEAILGTQRMEAVGNALERYIDANKKELLSPVGKNITRVKISDLADYGLEYDILENMADDFQLRILKTPDSGGVATLRGLVVMRGEDAVHTREMARLGGNRAGFADSGKLFGAWGTFRTNASDFDIADADGVVRTTITERGGAKYLWRTPSEYADDATMLSNLNIGGHEVVGAKYTDSRSLQVEETLTSETVVADSLTFSNRTNLDKVLSISEATVNGALSSDGRNLEVLGTLSIADSAKVGTFAANELWTDKLNLSGLTVATDGKAAILKVNQTVDMSRGSITAMFTNVGFSGSITPNLVVSSRLEDPANPGYFWDFQTNSARMYDLTLTDLNILSTVVARIETGTTAATNFNATAVNKNATVADFLNVLNETEGRVRAKYQRVISE